MDRRIYGLETEYGVACTSGGTRRLTRRGCPLPVPEGGHLGAKQQRLPPQRLTHLLGRGLAPRIRDGRV